MTNAITTNQQAIDELNRLQQEPYLAGQSQEEKQCRQYLKSAIASISCSNHGLAVRHLQELLSVRSPLSLTTLQPVLNFLTPVLHLT